MAGIVGTITSINDFLSKTQVCLSVKPNQPQVQSICLDEDRQYSIPAFQREVRWDDNNLKMLFIKLKERSGASQGQTLGIAYCFLGTLFEDSELEFPFIIDSPTGSMDFDKREAVADIIPKVFNQMISFVQSAEVKRFADRFYDNPDAQ